MIKWTNSFKHSEPQQKNSLQTWVSCYKNLYLPSEDHLKMLTQKYTLEWIKLRQLCHNYRGTSKKPKQIKMKMTQKKELGKSEIKSTSSGVIVYLKGKNYSGKDCITKKMLNSMNFTCRKGLYQRSFEQNYLDTVPKGR